jgi:hypothetical protein
MNQKSVEGSSHGLIWSSSQNLHGRTEENYKEPQNI